MAAKVSFKTNKIVNAMKASEWFAEHDYLPGMENSNPTKKAPKKKVPKRPLSEITTPVKASEWFAKNNHLPTDIIEEPKRSLTEKETPSANVKVDAPESIDVEVEIKVPSLSNSVTHNQASLENEKDKKVNKEIETLADSILDLTKFLKQEKVRKIESEEIDGYTEDNPRPKTIVDLFKKITKEKISNTREMFSTRNLLTATGIQGAYKGTGSIIDQVLTHFEDKKKNKEETHSPLKAALKEYTSNKFKNIVKEPAGKLYEGAKSIISNSSVGRISNSIFTTVGNKTDKFKDFIENKKLDVSKKLRTDALEKPNSLLGTIGRHYYPESGEDAKKLNLLDRARDPKTKEDLELRQGLKEGIQEELVTLNNEQIKQLKKIVAALTETKEEKLEREDKEPSELTFSQKKEEKKEENSLIKSIMESFGSLKGIIGKAGNLFGSLSKTLGPLLRFAAPVAGVAAAGAAGVAAGSMLNNYVINPLTEKITGTKGATLGTAVYDGVDKVKGWFGNSDADKQKKLEEELRNKRLSTSVKNMVVSSPVTTNNNSVSTKSDKIVNKSSDTLNIKNIEENNSVISKTSPTSNIISKTENQSNEIAVQPTKIKPAAAYRVRQMEQVQATIKETEKLKDTKRVDNKPSSIVDARTNVINNSSNIQYIRPSVKNNEPTFNHLLSINFNR